MENEDNLVEYSCECPDYSSDFSEIQTQLIEVNNNLLMIDNTIKGGNSIMLLLLVFVSIAFIYKLIRFVF